ncbi:MAG: pantoate--beta-alanine ligase [Actinobacteria bacterium]|nr:pantoate--beta-alanine ligase [Actinomycetota bacterium]
MKVVSRGADLVGLADKESDPALRIALVPTMGALHDGHLSLLRAARAESDLVVMSVFVNPRQFSSTADLDAYPRDEAGDLAAAESCGVDLVFLPPVEDMYPPGDSTTVSAGPLGAVLEGASRPGHFDGVATVVAKLFNLVEPDIAYFGQKDAQQLAVIRRMVTDLAFDVRIRACPTVRDADGLALSSRNRLLSPQERAEAPALHLALRQGAGVIERGGRVDDAARAMTGVLEGSSLIQVDYARAVDPATFQPAGGAGPLLLAVAARLGRVRLIDNLLLDVDGGRRVPDSRESKQGTAAGH